jgi:hypothetical protein
MHNGLVIFDIIYATAPFSFCLSIPILPFLWLLYFETDSFRIKSFIFVILSSLLEGSTLVMAATSSLRITFICLWIVDVTICTNYLLYDLFNIACIKAIFLTIHPKVISSTLSSTTFNSCSNAYWMVSLECL